MLISYKRTGRLAPTAWTVEQGVSKALFVFSSSRLIKFGFQSEGKSVN